MPGMESLGKREVAFPCHRQDKDVDVGVGTPERHTVTVALQADVVNWSLRNNLHHPQ